MRKAEESKRSRSGAVRSPIGSASSPGGLSGIPPTARLALILANRDRRTPDLTRYIQDLASQEGCRDGLPVRELPPDCRESAATPGALFAKLTDWGFSDQEFPVAARDALCYVRAIEEPSPTVNAANLRCEYDAEGNCVRVDPCCGSSLGTPYQDDCLAPVEERAWSSPIFVDFAR